MAEEYTIMLYVNFALERVADTVSNASAVLGHGPRMSLRFPFLAPKRLVGETRCGTRVSRGSGRKSLGIAGFFEGSRFH